MLKSFTDELISAEERIYLIWYAVFFLRFWKRWICSSSFRTRNFITSNAYMCIELNAHTLINAVIKCRDMNEQLLVWLCNSQPCEAYFRKARSQTSTYCTVVNFSLLDFLHRSKRIQAQEEIICDLKSKYVFARQNHHQSDNAHQSALPSNEQIEQIVLRSQRDAEIEIRRLGMTTDNQNVIKIQMQQLPSNDVQHDDSDSDTESEIETMNGANKTPDEQTQFDLYLLQQHNQFSNLNQLASVGDKMMKQCLRFQNEKGDSFFIRKSTLCWLLNNNARDPISSDRIRRFITNSKPYSNNRAQCKDMLNIGDWCEFKNNEKIGQVIGFKYMSVSRKESVYSLDSVPLEGPDKKKGVGVLCNWYNITSGFVLQLANDLHEYTDILHFKNHLQKPHINSDMQLVLDDDDLITNE